MADTPLQDLAVGQVGFIGQHGLFTDAMQAAAERAAALVSEQGIRTVRIGVVDQHGIVRCKFVSAHDFLLSLRNGIDFSGAILSLDTANKVFPPAFVEGGGFGISELTGFPDVVLVPDATTFQILPWASHTAWVLSDAYYSNGKPVGLFTRQVLRRQLEVARELGFEYAAGLEVEFYIFRREQLGIGIDETGWPARALPVSVVAQGYQYLSETRLAQISEILDPLRDHFEAIGLPLRTMEDEWGPGQTEITFDPQLGLAAADAMVLFRTATKQICHQLGYHATFMCRPLLPNVSSSGWHLHESLQDAQGGGNAFASTDHEALSLTGRQFAAGILEHAIPMTVFSTPTVNGFKRFKPYSFAPNRVNWALENRGSMLRVQGQPGDPGSHLENRLGEPAANPYLYMAANIAAGLDGIRRQLVPPPMVQADPYAEAAPALPASLGEAVEALDRDQFFRQTLGPEIVDYLVMLKRFEYNRYQAEVGAEADPAEVTEWEQNEYFEFF
ncbi:MAG TPA: glutamine synthetase family protein [Candidatus Dormibacteraeota bacterium]|nr:glutamine synthetase family protein [Candidatus Dormibacteraeota bacterium]